MNPNATKIVLVSKNGYSVEHTPFLQSLVDRRIELFSVVGRDCRAWEHAMDDLCIGLDGEIVHFMITTSHPDESVEDIVSLAEQWTTESGEDNGVEIIEL